MSPPTPPDDSAHARGAGADLFARFPLAVALLSHAFVAVVILMLFALRVGHPVEIGNVEGVLMDEAARLAQGRPLYVAPSVEFTPLAYMPGYILVVSWLVKLFGSALWVGRAVAVTQAVLLATLLGIVAWRESGSRVLGVAAVGLFLSAFGPTGGLMDLVQPNTQMLLLAFASVAALRWIPGPRGAVFAAVLAAASFFSKQHGLIFGLAVVPWLFARDRRRALIYVGTLVLLAGGGYLLLRAWLGPWFTFYTWDVPSHWSRINRVQIELFIGHTLFGDLAMCTLFSLVAVASGLRVWQNERAVWWWVGLGGAGASFLATLDPYAFRHTLMPVFTAGAVLAPIAAHHMLQRLGLTHARATAWTAGLLLAQYLGILYPVRTYLPHRDSIAAGRRLEARLREIPGDVWVPGHGWYGSAAGKGTSMHMLALDDIVRARGNGLMRRDPNHMGRLFDSIANDPGRPWLVMDRPLESSGDVSRPLWRSLAPRYRLVEDLGELTEPLKPPVGLREAPRYVYAPFDSAAPTP